MPSSLPPQDARWWVLSSLLLFAFQLHLLLLHHHHLHTFTHPRRDSYVLLLLEIMLCARRFIVAGLVRAQVLAARSSLPQLLPAVGAHAAVCSYVIVWMTKSGRPFMDALLLLPPIIAVAHDPALDQASYRSASFAEQVRALLLSSMEAAFYVGALPSIFARNEPILHEPTESYRIACLTFLNCLVLELLEIVRRLDVTRPLRDVVSADELQSITALGRAAQDAPARGRSMAAKRAAASPPAEEAPALMDDAQLLIWYIQNADHVHMAIIGVQSSLVILLLMGFLYTQHWRSHAVSLLANYALLYLCVTHRASRMQKPPESAG